ncbi:MAG: fasciclin domain-containing protein [Cytophagales bacterium]|nr:MAG: fasciclin domain-containing protein [Cytophagales bacterium]
MKLHKTLRFATIGVAWIATSALAQRVTTNPTAVPNTVSTPTFSPDTLRPSRAQILNDDTAGQDDASRKNRRDQKRAIRRSQRDSQNNRMNRGTTTGSGTSPNTNPDDGAYRQNSANGTAGNNSNTTNYNSNNVMTAPTGAGANPSATGAAGDVRPGTGSGSSVGSVEAGSTTQSATNRTSNEQPNLSRPAATGTGQAVSGAENALVINPSARSRSTTVADFVASQPNYATLQNALQSADLNETFKGGQAYTVFAPSNAAFKKLPAKTQNVLLEGQNREALKKLLTYHVVAGTLDAQELTRQITAGNGTARLTTLGGGVLTAKSGANGRILITDEQGNSATVDTPNQSQTNGMVHGINGVLMPKAGTVSFK